MFLVTLEDDDCANGGAFVFIGALASAIAKVKAQSKPLEVILNVERKLFGLVNGAIQVGALHPHDPETLVPLSKSDYGHGIVAIEELVAWGHSLSVPLDFKVAQNSAAPIAGRAAVSDASEHAHESPVRMTKAERQRMDDFFAEGLRRSQRVSEAAATARAAELARLNARDEYEASKVRQLPAPVQTAPAPVLAASNGPAKRRTWRDVTWLYMQEVFKSGQYATAKEFYRALETKAGANSPFEIGTGPNRGSLFVREISEKLTFKTVQNTVWPNLKNGG